MRREVFLGVLTAANLVLLLGIGLTQILPATAQGGMGILRGSAFELVDPRGRVRASLSIQPEVEGASETVLFRLIHPKADIVAEGAGGRFAPRLVVRVGLQNAASGLTTPR
ncbi:hypothetical protein [Mesorhizobium sp. LjNodule214]|uniref:hypothetical protein n=1 Tax=Mesorhizobium sp. LjNodule214 TaxID=3342252 RepID=UPI003ECC2E78